MSPYRQCDEVSEDWAQEILSRHAKTTKDGHRFVQDSASILEFHRTLGLRVADLRTGNPRDSDISKAITRLGLENSVDVYRHAYYGTTAEQILSTQENLDRLNSVIDEMVEKNGHRNAYQESSPWGPVSYERHLLCVLVKQPYGGPSKLVRWLDRRCHRTISGEHARTVFLRFEDGSRIDRRIFLSSWKFTPNGRTLVHALPKGIPPNGEGHYP